MQLAVALRLGLDLVLVLVLAAAAYAALDWPMRSGIMPLTMSVFGLTLGLLNLVLDVRRWRNLGPAFVNVDRGDERDVPDSADASATMESEDLKKGLRYLGWIFAFVVAVYLFGALIGAALFLAAYLRVEGRESWVYSIAGAIAAAVAITILERVLELSLPDPLLSIF